MRCSNVRQTVSEARYQGGVSEPSIAEHLTQCEACREFARASERLDAFLRLDQPVDPRPGFDTRFFAQLAELKEDRARRQSYGRSVIADFVSQWRWLLGGVSLACAMVAVLWARPADKVAVGSHEPAPLTAQELALARDLELVQDLDLVRRLREVETFEVLARLDLNDLERAGGSAAAEQGVGQ